MAKSTGTPNSAEYNRVVAQYFLDALIEAKAARKPLTSDWDATELVVEQAMVAGLTHAISRWTEIRDFWASATEVDTRF